MEGLNKKQKNIDLRVNDPPKVGICDAFRLHKNSGDSPQQTPTP